MESTCVALQLLDKGRSLHLLEKSSILDLSSFYMSFVAMFPYLLYRTKYVFGYGLFSTCFLISYISYNTLVPKDIVLGLTLLPFLLVLVLRR